MKGDRGGALAREISFVSLVAYGLKVSHSALAIGGYSFWNQAAWFPTKKHMQTGGIIQVKGEKKNIVLRGKNMNKNSR